MGFKLYLENTGVVSFDFDGVLHNSMIPGTIHPVNYDKWDTWNPNYNIFKILKNEAEKHDIIVVSYRNPSMKKYMWNYIHKYNLPVKEVYTTNRKPKKSVLVKMNVIRHYDDDPKLLHQLDGTGIEFIRVYH